MYRRTSLPIVNMPCIKKIRKKVIHLTKNKHTSLLIFIYGILIHFLSIILVFFPVMIMIGVQGLSTKLTFILANFLLLSPLLISFLGIISGFTYLLYRNVSLFPIIGILLNTIWLVTFFMLYIGIFVIGISV